VKKDDSESDPSSDDEQPAKKTDLGAVSSDENDESDEETKVQTPQPHSTPNKSPGVKRFQRVVPEEIVFTDERLKDNSFQAKNIGGGDTWGAKANETLSKVRGKGFRHEKTKRKGDPTEEVPLQPP